MSNAKKCDICGDLYENYHIIKNENNPNGFRFLSSGLDDSFFQYKKKDCCPKCMEAIMIFIDNLSGKNDGYLCRMSDCWYNSEGKCICCTDLWDPEKGEECLDYEPMMDRKE